MTYEGMKLDYKVVSYSRLFSNYPSWDAESDSATFGMEMPYNSLVKLSQKI